MIYLLFGHTLKRNFGTSLKNQQDDNIKFKAIISDKSVGLLDVTIYNGTHFETPGYLDYNILFKPTDTTLLLNIPLKTSLNHRLLDLQKFNEACSVVCFVCGVFVSVF